MTSQQQQVSIDPTLTNSTLSAPLPSTDVEPSHKRRVGDLRTAIETTGLRHVKRSKKDAKVDELEPYRLAARWISRSIDPFLNIPDAFKSGIALDAKDFSNTYVVNKSEVIRSRCVHMYNAMVDLVPGLRNTISSFIEDPAVLQMLLDEASIMSAISRQVRSDDTSSLKKASFDYLDAELSNTEKRSLTHKSTRGFNHPLFAKYLCPHRLSAVYAEDQQSIGQKLQDGEIQVRATDYAAFLYSGPYNPEAIDEGLLRGPILVRCYKHIFTSPTSVHATSLQSRKGRPSQAALHGLTRVTPRTIAYAAIQARHMLCCLTDWGLTDGAFDLEEFFLNVVDLFEMDPESDWAIQTLEWWDREVFKRGPRRAEDDASIEDISTNGGSGSDRDRLLAQRRARRAT